MPYNHADLITMNCEKEHGRMFRSYEKPERRFVSSRPLSPDKGRERGRRLLCWRESQRSKVSAIQRHISKLSDAENTLRPVVFLPLEPLIVRRRRGSARAGLLRRRAVANLRFDSEDARPQMAVEADSHESSRMLPTPPGSRKGSGSGRHARGHHPAR